MKRTVLKVSLFIFALPLFSCAEEASPGAAEIPFVIKGGRMLLYATVYGRSGLYVFDTGATASYLDVDPKGLVPARFVRLVDNGKRKFDWTRALNTISFGDVKLRTRSEVITPSSIAVDLKKTSGYDGCLGIGVFEGYWCEISFSKSKIILRREKPDYFTSHSPVRKIKTVDYDFLIPAAVDGADIYLEVDTGLPYGILFPEGAARNKRPDESREVVSIGEVERYHWVKTRETRILDETYTDRYIPTNSYIAERRRRAGSDIRDADGIGLMGLDFLQYYDWLLDCRELRKGKTAGLYYEPNTPPEDREYGAFNLSRDTPEFGALGGVTYATYKGNGYYGIRIRDLLKDSVAYRDFGLRPGSVLWRVNGMQFPLLPMEEWFAGGELFGNGYYRTIRDYAIIEDGVERTMQAPALGGAL
ncbi:MAG: hypothetical protein LBG43_10670 [Treponema sp.]|jgi:hypothetical protein|nr:hypothetical protein [Treponema sp.]